MGHGQAGVVEHNASKGSGSSDSWSGMLLTVLVLLPLLVLTGCTGLVSGKAPQASASFSITPSNLSFGKVTAGQKSSQNVTLTNTGSAGVTIQQATPSGAQWGISGITLPMALGAGQSTTFGVWLNGTTAGNVSGTLTLQGDSGTAPVVLNLSGTVTTSPQAQMTLAPAAVDFGTVSIGSKNTSSLTIGNTGAADLIISVITLKGAEFGITGIATPRTITSGQSVPVTLSYSPAATGAASGSITLTSNDPTTPTVDVPLSGTGTPAGAGQLTANTTSLSFGSVATGGTGTQSVILTNSGSTAVHISSVVAAGTGFSVSGVTTPATLNASQTATLNVQFAPTAIGSAIGTVKVSSDAPGSPLTVNLSGTGATAGLSVSPTSFNFGSVIDGQTKSQNFTITNTGSASLTISQLSVSGAGYSASGLATPATIDAGKSATFNALFAPTSAGALNGSVTITSNATNSPTLVALSGTGVAASVTISATPSSLGFGSVSAGSSSVKSVTVSNGGNSNITISQITVNAQDTKASGITTPMTLTPGQTAALNLTFSPIAAESVTGSVTVSSTTGASAVIPLTGTGVQAALTITPGSVSFGNVIVGAPNSQTLQLKNTGTDVLTITQLSVTGSGFGTSTVNLPLSLNPSASSTFNVQFAPTSAGSASGSVSVVSNAPNSPSPVALSGTGIVATKTLSFSSSSLAFGSVTTGGSASQNVTVTNTGNSDVQISQITPSGTGYSLSGATTPVTLTSGQNLAFTVTFRPTAAGSAPGSVVVSSNASGSPATITLSGNGVQTSSHSVALTWNASTSTVSGYNVYRSTVSGSGYSIVNSSLVGGLSYTDSNVQSAQTYYYVTTAVDGSGNESAYSNEAQAIIP